MSVQGHIRLKRRKGESSAENVSTLCFQKTSPVFLLRKLG